MKRLIALYLLLFLLIGCQNQKERQTVQISGTIHHTTTPTVRFYPFKSLATDKHRLREISLSEGQFSFTYELKETRPAMLEMNGQKHMVFLEPGHDLQLKVDETDSIRFEKDHQKNNAVFLEYQAEFSPFFRPSLDYSLSPKQFVEQVDSIKHRKEEFLNAKRDVISSSLENYIEHDIVYHAAKEKIYYARRFARQLVKNKDEYFSFLEDIEVQNDEAVRNVNYLFFVDNYINYLFLKKVYSGKFHYESQNVVMDKIARQKLQGEVLEQFQTENLALGIRHDWDKDVFRRTVDRFLDESRSEYLKNLVKQKVAKYLDAPLAKGKKAPGFTLKDKTGKSYTLKDFRGKYVVLDFWASWCGPCKRSMPRMIRLAEKHRDSTAFVFISIDQNAEDWRKASENLNIPEPSLIMNDSARKAYGFHKSVSVPFYLVLDQQGRVVLRNTGLDEIEEYLEELEN